MVDLLVGVVIMAVPAILGSIILVNTGEASAAQVEQVRAAVSETQTKLSALEVSGDIKDFSCSEESCQFTFPDGKESKVDFSSKLGKHSFWYAYDAPKLVVSVDGKTAPEGFDVIDLVRER